MSMKPEELEEMRPIFRCVAVVAVGLAVRVVDAEDMLEDAETLANWIETGVRPETDEEGAND